MPAIQILTPPVATAEPVSLALLKQHVRKDGNDEDELLKVYLSAAREKVEAYTGRYFAPQTLKITYSLSEPYELPEGATAASVSGYFDTLDALAARAAYLVEYRKGISISRDLDWPYPALDQAYTVTASIPETVNVPALAKAAILELAGEWYRNRETTTAGVVAVSELPVSWRVKLAPLVVNPLGV
jgi:hypothetical protein